jgi:hypothetical protein
MVVDNKQKIARQLQKELGIEQGFESLDLDALPPVINRPRPHRDPERQKQQSQKPKGDRRDRRGRSDDKRDKPRRGKSPAGQSRDMKRNDRDRDNRNRDDRNGRSANRNDRNRNERDRDDRTREGHHPRRKKRGGNDWYPPGWEDEEPKTRGPKTGGSGARKDGPSRGGSNSTPRKNRATKGRHADRNSGRNKGKRRGR